MFSRLSKLSVPPIPQSASRPPTRNGHHSDVDQTDDVQQVRVDELDQLRVQQQQVLLDSQPQDVRRRDLVALHVRLEHAEHERLLGRYGGSAAQRRLQLLQTLFLLGRQLLVAVHRSRHNRLLHLHLLVEQPLLLLRVLVQRRGGLVLQPQIHAAHQHRGQPIHLAEPILHQQLALALVLDLLLALQRLQLLHQPRAHLADHARARADHDHQEVVHDGAENASGVLPELGIAQAEIFLRVAVLRHVFDHSGDAVDSKGRRRGYVR